ncbi:PREDICTED: activating signal cointegrator 1 complex subunit 2 isoform X1 [Fragaria vesca subsp. vesca]|uniref:activating signal cointegrator 1 complex subunit 2 isoform X1 n=1 Tax=Fragaria vesca subsp. vesca TaxID=101020 RepID=UPI0002C36C34|nr:PREDICTED: activating signal cointegrator 1 complex subunit 2 isoform X1 [Fragaria vesca subsp. vesca]
MSSHRNLQGNSSNRQAGGSKGFAKSQKVFVPKIQDQNRPRSPKSPNPTLSSSLRQSLSQPSNAAAAPAPSATSSSSSRVRMGEKGEWVSTKGNFVNYLPQDEAVAAGLGADEGGLDALESQRVVDLLNRELSRLLKLNPKEFWRQVASDTSLHEFLESFLQFRSRWYDFPHRGAKDTVAGVIVGELELSRRVFMVLYRISSNRDPGARAADSLSTKDHAALLQDKKLLDLPKLLDICAIYSHENEDLTGVLVGNAVKAHPTIFDNLTALASHFLSIVQTMYQRSSTALEALFLSGNPEEHGSSRLLADLLEVMDFINDAIVSMDAFLTAYKPSAIFFLCPVEKSYGSEELLSTLTRLHDSLLPSLQRGFQIILAAGEDKMVSNVAISLKMLSFRIVKFGWKLLDSCYLSDEVFKENIPIPAAAEMFPAKLEDPVIRADILVQMLREINGISVGARENQTRETFLQNVEKNFNMIGRVENLQNHGWLIMDDEQLGYLSGILMCSQKVIGKPHTNATSTLTNNKVAVDEDFAIKESKISQVKDLFPEYGKGFLAACLEAYNQNPEEVIQRILEGTLHEDLRSLDTKLETMPKPRSATVCRNDKGKGILVEPTASTNTNTVVASRVQQNGVPSVSSSSSQGRFVRKSKADLPVSDTLDDKNEKYSAKTAALISQFEYEDEYDDSFDDLGLSVGDSGVGETESYGEKSSSNMGKPWETRTEGSSQNTSSKWGSRQNPQYYVKDGKNYSYKVAGSVAVANMGEASLITQAQQELIHGLGRGGNLPLGAVKKLTEYSEQQGSHLDTSQSEGRGKSRSWGRGGGGGERRSEEQDKHSDNSQREGRGRGYVGNSRGQGRGRGGRSRGHSGEEQDNKQTSVSEVEGTENAVNQRGRGRRGGGGGRSNHYRKDQAMKKHFSGLGGL